MKAKVSRGGGFKGVLNYVFDVEAQATGEKKPEFCGGNMSSQTPQALAKEFGITKNLRPDCKKPVWHCSLSLPEGDRLSANKWGELAQHFMIEMGMDPANFLYSAVRHNDTDYDHIHIVASRIGLDGSLWHGKFEALKAIDATQALEKMHGLTPTPGLELEHKKDRKSLTHGELNMAIRTEMKPPRTVCQDAIDEVLQDKGVITAPQFIGRLAALGVHAVPSVASTGTMNGFSFEAEGVSFTGSKLGEGYKWAKLQLKGVEYVKNRDFEELADTKRRAADRATAGPDAGRDQRPAGLDSAPSAELGAAAEPGSRPGERVLESTGPDLVDAPRRAESFGSVRPSDESAAADPGSAGGGAEQPGSAFDGSENSLSLNDAGIRDGEHRDAPARAESQHGLDGRSSGQDSGVAGAADNGLERLGDGLEQGGWEARDSGAAAERADGPGESQTSMESMGRVGGSGSAGRNAGAGWAAGFKQNSAAQRRANLAKSQRPRKSIVEQDRVTARTIDPTAYLRQAGFDVKTEGRHLSVRQHGDEVYRVTCKPDGHWITCDKYQNGIGDNIALVQEIEPCTSFSEAVYRLAGAPSVGAALRPAAPAPVRQPPQMPTQAREDVRRGREYLQGRGISLETYQQAEKAGMLRYSAGGVLFVGRDQDGTAWNIMRRAVEAQEGVQKRDLSGTDKRHPQMLLGASETVLIVEGGADALAAHDLARRQGRPVPTVLVSGGANVRSWMQTPWVQAVLKLAKKIIVAFEHETCAETQAKTDAAHQVQIDKLREMCGGAEVVGWKPPEGIKDMAALNEHHQAAAQTVPVPRSTSEHALRIQAALQQHCDRESRNQDLDRNQGMSMQHLAASGRE